jgi:transcriptional regulator with XRE-family HTH domain
MYHVIISSTIYCELKSGGGKTVLTRLGELRKSRKWSMQETADRLGIAKSTYAGYESGYREPSLQALSQLADLFDTTIDYLLKRGNDGPNIELIELLNSKDNLLSLDQIPLSSEEIIDFIAFTRVKRGIKKASNPN